VFNATYNDIYIFNLGDGQLEIMDANGLDKLKFGEGISKDDITITQEADGFVYIRINNTTRASMPPVMVSSPARA
jgi:hypothetical protein